MITLNAQIKALPVDRSVLSAPPARAFFCAERASTVMKEVANDEKKRKHREYMKGWRKKNPDKVRASKSKWASSNKEKINEQNKRWKLSHKEHQKIYNKVYRKVKRGTLARPNKCSCCGDQGVRIEGHHDNYALRYNLLWLCRACHVSIHMGKPTRQEGRKP